MAEYERRYLETLLAVDESLGRILDLLRRRGLLEKTLVLFVGDNGFAFGEHGLIDKRTAYEESIRVPLLMRVPGAAPGTVVDQLVANLDVAPTLLDAAGLRPPAGMDGAIFLPLARGQRVPWREDLLYEYYWERNFPHTPTVHALRGQRYKYIRYHGLWDVDELFDLQQDPQESRNLVAHPDYREIVASMNARLFDLLEASGGMSIPLTRDRGSRFNLRRHDAPPPAAFPPSLIAPETVAAPR